MTAEFYVEGIAKPSKQQGPGGVFGAFWGDPPPSKPGWFRLTEKPFQNHDEAGEWLAQHGEHLVIHKLAAVRIIRVVSWHTLNVNVRLPLSSGSDVASLVRIERRKARDPHPIPGEEWKEDPEEDHDG